MATSAVRSIRVAVYDAIKTIPALQAAGVAPGVYLEGVAPKGTLPYAILGTWSEPDQSRYIKQPGRSQTGQIKWWGKDLGEAQALFEAGMAVLDGVLLTLGAGRMIRCRLAYALHFKEPDLAQEVRPWGIVSELTTTTLAA